MNTFTISPGVFLSSEIKCSTVSPSLADPAEHGKPSHSFLTSPQNFHVPNKTKITNVRKNSQ